MATAPLNGARIAYDDTGVPPLDVGPSSELVTGGAALPLLLVHAGIADRGMWDAQVVAFAPTRRVVRFDQRGFGGSDAPPDAFAPAEDARALLDHLGIDRAVVVGDSMGGEVAIELALTHPDRVAGLVLCSTRAASDEASPELVAIWETSDAAFQAGDRDRAVGIEAAAWVDGRARPAGTLDPAARARAVAMIRSTWERANDQPGERTPLDPPRQGRLAEVACPTLVLRGDLDLPEITASTDRLAAGIPGATVAVIPNAAHLPPLEQPDAFNRLLADWLTTVG